jgi:hypothetical protein
MSDHCYDYFEGCGGVLEAFLAEMPTRIQDRIRDRLRALAEVQAESGDIHASEFSRLVSGQPPAPPQQVKRRRDHLRLVKA